MLDSMEHIQVGDEVKVRRGRAPDAIARVYKVTPKTFDVAGYGRFWKQNGKGFGDADSWYGRYASDLSHGDRVRIDRETKRRDNAFMVRELDYRQLNDEELAAVAKVIRAMKARREAERKADDETH